jgi:hypothetical protein
VKRVELYHGRSTWSKKQRIINSSSVKSSPVPFGIARALAARCGEAPFTGEGRLRSLSLPSG